MDIRPYALSNANGEADFVHVTDPKLDGYSGLKARPYPRQVATEVLRVPTRRLDDDLPAGWLPSFVKIDVEGAEPLVIEGGIETLRSAQPILAFEHGARGSEEFGVSDEDLFKLLTADIGLRVFDTDGRGPLDLPQFKDELGTREHWNWIAHP